MGFEQLEIRPELIKAIKRMGFKEPTPIQESSIPEIIAGHDVVGQSLTGSGKTAAYSIPILERIEKGQGIQVLILTPTRELALQVKDKIDELASFMHVKTCAVYGGVAINPQIDSLRSAEIVMATPGRMLDHIGRGTINLDNINTLVLDEADRMLEMGFIDDVKEIMEMLPRERQNLLFSATMPSEILRIIRSYLKSPKMIEEELHVDADLLTQLYYDVRPSDKFSLLVHLLKNKTEGLAIVFCETRREVDVVAKNLKKQGVHAKAVHGGLSQNNRTSAVDSLKSEDIQVLVATDVAARGLDVNNITNIYNYDSPKTPEDYTHRIGRTARAGKSGYAVTLLTQRDHDNFSNIVRNSGFKIDRSPLPKYEVVPFVRSTPERKGNMRGNMKGRRNAGNKGRGSPRPGSSRSGSSRSSSQRSGSSRQGSSSSGRFGNNKRRSSSNNKR